MQEPTLQLKTVNDVLFAGVAHKTNTALKYRDESWNWTTVGHAEVYRRVRVFAAWLLNAGVHTGDRVAILAENRWEWAVADFAILGVGAVDVPLYPTLLPEQIRYMLADSGARVAIVSTREQARKVLDVQAGTAVERIIVMDGVNLEGTLRFSEIMSSYQPVPEAEYERVARSVRPEALATIIYTSGTTGEPKGVMLTHGNIASNLNYSTTLFRWSPEFSCISFLPLSHITARALDYAVFSRGATIAYCPDFADVVRTFREIKPRIVVSVPRVYEKVRQEVERKASASSLKKKILAWAVGVGRKNRDTVLALKQPGGLQYSIAKKLIFSKVWGVFGGNATHFISGGAPLGMDTAGWFADVGIVLFEGYGLTETSPVISLNNPEAHRIGSVGKILPNLEVDFAPDDELLVRGPSIFAGYWNNEKATAEAFSGDGAARWFHTGDIAHMDADGFLFITDRKKELLKTSGGKFIAPALIENKVKANVLIAHAALVGDKRKFASLIISPNFAALETWCRQNGVPSDVSTLEARAALVGEPRVVAEYQRIVDQVNATLAQYETIKKIFIAPEEWSLESGELTPSMKLKRRVINQNYADEVDEMYDEG